MIECITEFLGGEALSATDVAIVSVMMVVFVGVVAWIGEYWWPSK